MPKPRPEWSPLGVKFKISDEHPRLFHTGASSRDHVASLRLAKAFKPFDTTGWRGGGYMIWSRHEYWFDPFHALGVFRDVFQIANRTWTFFCSGRVHELSQYIKYLTVLLSIVKWSTPSPTPVKSGTLLFSWSTHTLAVEKQKTKNLLRLTGFASSWNKR